MNSRQVSKRAFVWGLLLAAAVFLLIPSAAQAQHWLPGLFPNRTMAKGEPGFYAMMFFYNYNAGSLRDSNGDKHSPERPDGSPIIAGDLDLFAVLPIISYTAKPKVLGGTYSIRWGQPFTNASLSVLDRDGQTGMVVFDPLFMPLALSWGVGRTDITVTWGMWLPLGSEGGGTENAFSSQTQLGGLLYFDAHKKTALNFTTTWETNSSMFGRDFKFGDFLTLDYGFGHITPFWNFGFTGYTRWQIQDNSGADAGPPPEHRLFTTAVGGEFGYFFLKARLDVALRVMTDVSSISAPKGTTIALNFIWLAVP